MKIKAGVKIKRGKKCEWMLNPGKYFAEEKNVCMVLKCGPVDCLLVIKEDPVITN